jgi:ribosome-binding protein aMBF1 (putative translation factor)
MHKRSRRDPESVATPRLPDVIRNARRQAGWSQGELARRASISRTAVNRAERGRADPTLETLRALVRVLPVHVHNLIAAVLGATG